MKSIVKIILVCAFFFPTISLAQLKEYISIENSRIEKAKQTEKRIQEYIASQLKDYELPEFVLKSAKESFEHEQSEHDDLTYPLADFLETIKKSEIRKLYYKAHPEIEELNVATPMPVASQIDCLNSGFELGVTGYSFWAAVAPPTSSCSTPSIQIPANVALPAFPINDTTAEISLISAIGMPNDPFLATLPTPVFIPTTLTGNDAIKLNGSVRGDVLNVTTMTRSVHVDEPILHFNFSLIMLFQVIQHPQSIQPFFRVRAYDATGVVINEICIVADPDNCIFTSVNIPGSAFDVLYSGWRCGMLDLTSVIDDNITLEFTIADCAFNGGNAGFRGGHFGTVYLDDVCNGDCIAEAVCCSNFLNTDVNVVSIDNQQRHISIQATNTINNGARAVYHADGFVELLPEAGSLVTTGFEAELGSEFVAYIEDCTDNFEYRQHNTTDSPDKKINQFSKLQIYPNPSNTFVTITLDSDKIRSIVITSIDGKVIQSLNVNSHAEQIDVSGFTNGLYLITVQTEDGRNIVNKFIKN